MDLVLEMIKINLFLRIDNLDNNIFIGGETLDSDDLKLFTIIISNKHYIFVKLEAMKANFIIFTLLSKIIKLLTNHKNCIKK